MSAGLRIRQTHSSGRAIGRSALAALWEAWTAHTLSRAIADVASTSDKNYRDLGFDKAEILAALGCLRDGIALGRADHIAYSPRAMAAEIVEDDDVARAKPRHQELLDVGAEDGPGRTVDDARCGECIGPGAARNVRVRQRSSGAKPFGLSPLIPSRGSGPCWS
jgi:hypothetical protein